MIRFLPAISDEDIITEPVIRTEEGDFQVLSVLDSTEMVNKRGNKVNEFVYEYDPFPFDPHGFIEPDGSVEAGSLADGTQWVTFEFGGIFLTVARSLGSFLFVWWRDVPCQRSARQVSSKWVLR